jgi:hypothetical protein
LEVATLPLRQSNSLLEVSEDDLREIAQAGYEGALRPPSTVASHRLFLTDAVVQLDVMRAVVEPRGREIQLA